MATNTTPWAGYVNLDDVPALQKANAKPALLLSKLLLSDQALEMLQLHLDTVDPDMRHFNHSIKEQYSASTWLSHLGLHIPDEILTDIKQCLCGTDHSANANPIKQREIGWNDVSCTSWIKLVSTHDHGDENCKALFI
ncbi:hypothetical protein OG21DRAFT_1526146 [Imleria badia]|nr:hypothetical protein OG21DRAFT_1526146 [Imleria badia]